MVELYACRTEKMIVYIHIYIDNRLIKKIENYLLGTIWFILGTCNWSLHLKPYSGQPFWGELFVFRQVFLHVFLKHIMYFLQQTKLGTLCFSLENLKTNMNNVTCYPSFADSSIIYWISKKNCYIVIFQ